MNDTELCFTPAVEIARWIKAKELSPVEVIEGILRRIEQVNSKINAYCTIAADQARTAA